MKVITPSNLLIPMTNGSRYINGAKDRTLLTVIKSLSDSNSVYDITQMDEHITASPTKTASIMREKWGVVKDVISPFVKAIVNLGIHSSVCNDKEAIATLALIAYMESGYKLNTKWGNKGGKKSSSQGLMGLIDAAVISATATVRRYKTDIERIMIDNKQQKYQLTSREMSSMSTEMAYLEGKQSGGSYTDTVNLYRTHCTIITLIGQAILVYENMSKAIYKKDGIENFKIQPFDSELANAQYKYIVEDSKMKGNDTTPFLTYLAYNEGPFIWNKRKKNFSLSQLTHEHNPLFPNNTLYLFCNSYDTVIINKAINIK